MTYGAVDTANCNAPSYESFDPDVKEPKFLNKVKPTMIHIKSIAVGTTSVALNQSFVQFVTAPTLLMPKVSSNSSVNSSVNNLRTEFLRLRVVRVV